MNFRLPGPTSLPADVLDAMRKQMIDHRGAEFADLLRRITATTQALCGARQDLFFLSGSGWAGVESMIANTLNAGDRALAVSAGYFGEKFGEIAAVYGVNVESLTFPDGAPLDPDAVAAYLRAHPGIRAVLLTHNESYTGVLHPLGELAAAIRASSDALILVDAVSALGGVATQFDAWGIDALSAASQKALMGPPGIATVAVGPRAWEAYKTARAPRFSMDWAQYRDYFHQGMTPFTPSLAVMNALDVAAARIRAEGIEAVLARHERVAAFTRERVRGLGLALFANPGAYSPTLTAVRMPDDVNGDAVRVIAREMGVELGGSWGRQQGRLLRIGHMGATSEAEIDEAVEVLGEAVARARRGREA